MSSEYHWDYVDLRTREKLEGYGEGKFSLESRLTFSCYQHAVVLPYKKGGCEGGVIDSDGAFVKNTTVHEDLQDGLYPIDDDEVGWIDKDVIFIGDFFSVYGHAITDNLKKIWFLKTKEAQEVLAKGGELIYITFHGQELAPFVLRLFELAGVDISKAHYITAPTRFRQVIVPDNSLVLNGDRRYFAEEFRHTIEVIKNNAGKEKYPTYDKVYFSRTAMHQRRDYGEKIVEEEFRRHGYHIIHPEQLSLEHQIQLAANCKEFVATMGSVSHTSIFCTERTQIILLLKSNYYNGYQTMINEFAHADVTLIDINHSLPLVLPWSGPFYMSYTKHLAKFFSCRHCDIYILDSQWYQYLWRYLQTEVVSKLRRLKYQLTRK